MAYEEKKMFEGNWKCSKCGTKITKLPFEPDPEKADTLKCLDCFREGRPPREERRKFQGNWKCSGCDADITELPFEPRDESNLKCFDCFKKSKEEA